MAFMSDSHNLPTVVRYIYRYLLDQSDGSEDRDRLISLLVPGSLTGPAGKEPGEPGAYSTQHTLKALELIGLLHDDGERIRLSDKARSSDYGEFPLDIRFQLVLRDMVFDEVMVGDPWDLSGERKWNTDGTRDFVRSVTWFLAQDALGEPKAFGVKEPLFDAEHLQAEQFRSSKAPKVISNATAWDNFERWACALGLARRVSLRGSTYLAPDPTVAMHQTLSVVLSEGDWSALPEVMEKLYSELPILGRGRYRSGLDQHLAADPDETNSMRGEPSSVSQALLTLRDQGAIEMRSDSDANVVILADLPEPVSWTHIRLCEA